MAKKKKPSEEGQENPESGSDADNFGLPDIDYKPLDNPQENPAETGSSMDPEPTISSEPYAQQEKSPESVQQRSTYSYTMQEDNKSNAPVVIGVVIALVIVAAGFLIYQYVWKPQQEKERREQLARENARKKQEEAARQAQLQREEEERLRQLAADSAALAAPKDGTIETLSDRTMRYYVVITSAVDGDLVMDYAKKLSAKGVNTKIIPPFGKYKFSRLAIADYDTFAGAQSSADAVKAEYGSEVWVLKF